MKERIRSTTILCVRRDDKVVMAGDGQVTLGSEVLKSGAKKLRRLYNGKVIARPKTQSVTGNSPVL